MPKLRPVVFASLLNLSIHLFLRLVSSLEAFAATYFLLLIAASRVFFSSRANALEIPVSNSVSLRINSLFRTIMPLAKRSSRAFLPTFYRNVKIFSSVVSRSFQYFFSAHTLARRQSWRSRNALCVIARCVTSPPSSVRNSIASRSSDASARATHRLCRARSHRTTP
jgi:hypothetical protein